VVCGKPVSVVFSPRDSWFFKSDSTKLKKSMFVGGLWNMRKLVRNINPNLWWEFKFDPKISDYSGGIQFMTKKYLLGNGNDPT
jgi:hypothetical protein